MDSLLGSIFKKEYTIGELMNIDSGRMQRAEGCSVTLVNIYHELKKESLLDKFRSMLFNKPTINVYYVILKFQVVSVTGSVHIVYVRLNPDFNLNEWLNNKIKIYCDCSDFKYRSAYILNQRNALFTNDKIKIALGQSLTDSPKRKNLTTLCKHSFAVLNWIISNYSNIMKTI